MPIKKSLLAGAKPTADGRKTAKASPMRYHASDLALPPLKRIPRLQEQSNSRWKNECNSMKRQHHLLREMLKQPNETLIMGSCIRDQLRWH